MPSNTGDDERLLGALEALTTDEAQAELGQAITKAGYTAEQIDHYKAAVVAWMRGEDAQ